METGLPVFWWWPCGSGGGVGHRIFNPPRSKIEVYWYYYNKLIMTHTYIIVIIITFIIIIINTHWIIIVSIIIIQWVFITALAEQHKWVLWRHLWWWSWWWWWWWWWWNPDAQVTAFCLHIRPSPFAVSVYTLHIFLSLSNSFLSVSLDAWLYYTCSLPLWEIQHGGTRQKRPICQKRLIFMICKNPGHLASRIKIYGIPGLLWSNRDECDPPSWRTLWHVLAT